MNNRFYLILFVLGLAFILCVFILGVEQENSDLSPPFYQTYVSDTPVNEITNLSLFYADNQPLVSVVKDDLGHWRITTLDSFPADQVAVEKFLAQINALKTWQIKTRNPNRYQMLGVEPLTSIDAQGVEVSLGKAQTRERFILGLPIGINEHGESRHPLQQQSHVVDGYYARIEEQSFSILGRLDMPVSQLDWLETGLLLPLTRDISHVTSIQPDNLSFTLAISDAVSGSDSSVTSNTEEKKSVNLISVNGQGDSLPSLRYQTVFSGFIDGIFSLKYVSVKKSTLDYASLKAKHLTSSTELIMTTKDGQKLGFLLFSSAGKFWLKASKKSFVTHKLPVINNSLTSGDREINSLLSSYIFELSPYYYRLLTRPFHDYTL